MRDEYNTWARTGNVLAGGAELLTVNEIKFSFYTWVAEKK